MKFIQHYSSSKGNLYEVRTSKGRIVIDPGVRDKPLMQALEFDTDILFCLCTHEHQDHSKGVKYMLQNGIDVYASKGTLRAIGQEYHHRTNAIDHNMLLRIGGIEVLCFNTEHDAAEPMGFAIRDGSEYLLFVTDTKVIKADFKVRFNIIAVECNYSDKLLKQRVEDSDINEAHAKRLLTSHMSKKSCLKFLQKHCNLENCHEIHLLHMSDGNINKEKTREQFEKNLFIKVVTV
jgi:phosphoribosyl 1,2-cyclic phosphodiesterase